jgi:APA family basic amino acid/polyamine antiporter
VIKVAVVLLVIAAGFLFFNREHFVPFIPPNTGAFGDFGVSGIFRGAAVIFFAYIGFDAVSTSAQEARNPQRDMPIGIIGSLLVCTILYIVVAAIATGVLPYTQLDVPDPIAKVADAAGLGWISSLIKLGAIAGLTSVILVQLLGQSRVFYSMSRDGLLPPFVNRIHPRFRTPWITSIVTGIAVAIPAAILPVRDAAKLVSIGTLLAFIIVSIGIIVLRVREPDLPRPFRTPLVWFTAPAGALSAAYLMCYLDIETWIRLLVWLAIGLTIYFLYGRHHARVAS